MSDDFYLSAKVYGDNILYRGWRNGKKISSKIPYSPSIFIPTNEETKYKTLYNEPLKKIKPGSIKKTREYVKKYESVENFKIYGNTKFEYCLISDLFPDTINWDIKKIRIGIVDIEVNSDPETGGFAKPHDPFQPIISIAYKILGENKTYLLGYDDFDPAENVVYIKCRDEYDLSKKFIDVWSLDYPDVISGWNSDNFDLTYMINRFNKIIGEKETRRMSPWGIITNRVVKRYNPKFNRFEEDNFYNIYGVASLDYLEVFKKYHPDGKSQEQYKLDFIAETQIGQRKVEYEGTLHQLYTRDKQKFYEYNIQDVNLIEQLDNKFNLFYLVLALAFYTKTNFEDPYHQTRLGDALCYNNLKAKNIQVPNFNDNEALEYAGGFVKKPLLGFYKWPATVDATSLYPSVINGFNISPETIVNPKDYTNNMRRILSQGLSVDSILNKQVDLTGLVEDKVCLAPNGQFFRTDIRGFIPDIVEDLFNKRREYKKTMLDYEKDLEVAKKNGTDTKELLNNIAKYNALQTATKLVANSVYGALGSKYFRFYDSKLAEAITLSGQLANKWTAKNLNDFFNTLLKSDKDYILFMDTDSCGIYMGELVDKFIPKEKTREEIVRILYRMITEKIQPKIDDFCSELGTLLNVYKNTISYKLEKICSSGIFVAKKRYALNVFANEGVFYNEPKIKVTGLEIVKSSTPAIVRDALKNCIKIILDGTEDDLKEYLLEFKSTFNSMPIEKISFPRGVKGMDKYYSSSFIYGDKTPIHVRGSLLFNHYLEEKGLHATYEQIKESDKIKYCYLKLPNPIREDVISFPEKLPKEFGLDPYIDYDTMWNKTFVEPISSVTELIGWELERRNKIDDFF